MIKSIAESSLTDTQWQGFLSTTTNSAKHTDAAADDDDDVFGDGYDANDSFWRTNNSKTFDPPLHGPDEIAIDMVDTPSLEPGDEQTTLHKNLYVDDASHLDSFLLLVYQYYVHGGIGAFVLAKLTNILKLTFIAALFFVTGTCIDLAALLHALEHQSEPDLDQHVHLSDFIKYQGFPFWTMPLVAVFCLYMFTMVLRTAYDVHRMLTVRDFYHFELNLRRVHSLRWSEVAERIILSNEMQRVGIGHSPIDIVARIMRKANYFVALTATGALAVAKCDQNILMGSWNALFSRSNGNDSNNNTVLVVPVMTQTLEWAMQCTLFSFAFPHATALRKELVHFIVDKKCDENDFKNDTWRYEMTENRDVEREWQRDEQWQAMVDSLSNRFRLMAVLGIIFLPFVLCYLFVDFLLENGQQCRLQPQSVFSTRQWSTDARWLFREYNELPHYFRRRLAHAHRSASKFINTFARPKTTIVARFVSYCIGSFIFSLILFGLLYDDDVLTRVDVALGRSGVWWVGVLGALIAITRSYVSDENAVFEPQRHLRDTALHTHYMPRDWIDKEHTVEVRRSFSRFFQHRWTLSACELLSVIFTPYLLWSVLPRRSDALLRFIVENTLDHRHLGHICRYSMLRVDRDGDTLYGGRYKTRDCAPRSPDRYQTQNGKVETSLMNFASQYPRFQPDMHNSMFIESMLEQDASTTDVDEKSSDTSLVDKCISDLLLSAKQRAM